VKQEKSKQKLFLRSEKRGFCGCFAWKQKSEAKLSEIKRNERSEKKNVIQNDTKETYMVAKRKWDAKLNVFFLFKQKNVFVLFVLKRKM
jgi:hypothetical protein